MTGRPENRWQRAAAGIAERFTGREVTKTTGSLHIRNPLNTDRLLALFILASIPAAIVGTLSAGTEYLAAIVAQPDLNTGWRMFALTGAAASPDDAPAVLLLGLTIIAPLVVVATMTSITWEIVFAALRRRPVDPGWPMASWLFVLLLPPGTPLVLAAIGMTFGAVLGKHIFGGTGRYIASPAVLGALFLHYAYPALVADMTIWNTADGLATAEVANQGMSWWQTFAGREPGLLGTGSALACMAGALWLAVAGVASLRTLTGALFGLLLAATIATALGGTYPAHWHFALGSFAFCWAFTLTDPTTLPLTRGGRWLHGIFFGVLVVLMREADPTHPEGTLFAVLLAGLFVPLIDFAVLRAQHLRFGGQLEIEK
jgi:Na+-transporting NADH:ubiquinone oxidoreductase subunit B